MLFLTDLVARFLATQIFIRKYKFAGEKEFSMEDIQLKRLTR